MQVLSNLIIKIGTIKKKNLVKMNFSGLYPILSVSISAYQ